jgi:hypothetical protein
MPPPGVEDGHVGGVAITSCLDGDCAVARCVADGVLEDVLQCPQDLGRRGEEFGWRVGDVTVEADAFGGSNGGGGGHGI